MASKRIRHLINNTPHIFSLLLMTTTTMYDEAHRRRHIFTRAGGDTLCVTLELDQKDNIE